MKRELSIEGSREEVVRAVAKRYQGEGRRGKKVILEELIKVI
jgi:hypothetical protein